MNVGNDNIIIIIIKYEFSARSTAKNRADKALQESDYFGLTDPARLSCDITTFYKSKFVLQTFLSSLQQNVQWHSLLVGYCKRCALLTFAYLCLLTLIFHVTYFAALKT